MEKKNKLINDFTDGNIPKKMLMFAVPFMISNLMQVLYSLVDMIVVGQFVGSYGLSAVSVASQIFTFMTMVCLGFSNGGQVLIAQLIGAGRRDKLNKAIGSLFSIVLLMVWSSPSSPGVRQGSADADEYPSGILRNGRRLCPGVQHRRHLYIRL